MGLAASAQEPYVNTAGLNVVVLGGNDTAMDCVRTAAPRRPPGDLRLSARWKQHAGLEKRSKRPRRGGAL